MIRAGTVAYLNSVPLTSHLDRARFEVVADHPRGIAASLQRGDVDVALAPVAAVLTEPSLRIVPGWCIGADGPVASVLFAAETPPEAWTEVLLDGQSRTSVVLARLLAARGPLASRVAPGLRWTTVAPGQAPALAGGTRAAVVIGDPARALDARFRVRLDLAELWREWTGLPFVFAVWAGRADLPADARDALVAAGRAGVARIDDTWTGEDRVYLRDHIRYPFDERALMGLRRFAALASDAGLLQDAEVHLYPPPRHRPVESLSWQAALAAPGRLPLDLARALLTDAPRALLAMAASARRRAVAGDEVTWLVAAAADPRDPDAWAAALATPHARAILAPGLEALAPHERAERLAAARAAGLQVGGVDVAAASADVDAVVWRPSQPLPEGLPAGLVVEAQLGLDDPSDDAFLRELAAVHAAGARVTSVCVHLLTPPGAPLSTAGAGPDRWLRRVSVARLVLDVPHVCASPHTVGLDLSQLALSCGADDLGPVGPGDVAPHGSTAHETALAEAERVLRAAGQPHHRRDLRFQDAGGPVTEARRVRPVEERARA